MGPLTGFVLVLLTGCAQALPAATPERAPSPTPTASPSPTPTASPSPTPTASPSPTQESTPAKFGPAGLSQIVLSEDHLESGWTLEDVLTGREALVQPVERLEHSSFAEQPGFVDARITKIGTSGQGSYWLEGGYVTWAAVYANDDDAEAALEVLIHDHVSETGWAMRRVGLPPHGDEGVLLEGAAYDWWDDNLLHIWRDANLLLAAGAFGVTATLDDAADRLRTISDGMVERAR